MKRQAKERKKTAISESLLNLLTKLENCGTVAYNYYKTPMEDFYAKNYRCGAKNKT